MHVLTAGLEIAEERDAVADLLEVVDGQRHIDGARHGDQMQHRVGGTAQGHDDDHGVLKGGACHDVARLDVSFQ